VQLRELIDRMMLRVNTACPGTVESFDAATQTAKVLPSIRMKTYIGEEGFLDYPPIVNVPVVFPFASTAGFALTLPVRQGDPCLLVFSQRAIDNWHENGGVQPPEDAVAGRHHDLTDAIAIMAPSPLSQVLGAWEADGIELRNRAKTSRITLKDDSIEAQCGSTTMTIDAAGTVEVVAPSAVTVTTPLATFSGNLQVGGSVTAAGQVSDGTGSMQGIRNTFNTHTHPGDSGGTTGTPNQSM
jgi:hypothetical protein